MHSRFRPILIVLLLCPASSPAQLQPGDLVAICGDSITEQKQYSVFIQTYLLACRPDLKLRAMQFGWSGETSWGFAARLENDVLRFKPTVATTCYGMNDGGYAPLTDERARRYREATTQIVQKLKDAGVRFIVVGSPGAVDSHTFRNDPAAARVYNETLSQLRDVARDVAREHGVAFADVHDAMIDAMTRAKEKLGSAYHVGGADGVHAARNGHLVMALAFLKALGCDGDIGTITVDLASGTAEASEGHRVIESSPGVVQIESTRYPFCFSGESTSPDATSGMIQFMPFNEDLNRLRLVVLNAPAGRMKVTWGRASREFESDALRSGINLAAEFAADNPFSEPFAAVETAVRQQQGFQTPMIRQFIHNIPVLRELAPAQEESIDKLFKACVARHDELARSASEALKPVRHSIVIEPVD